MHFFSGNVKCNSGVRVLSPFVSSCGDVTLADEIKYRSGVVFILLMLYPPSCGGA